MSSICVFFNGVLKAYIHIESTCKLHVRGGIVALSMVFVFVYTVFLHDKHSSQKWDDDDVEIGRCISRKLNFQCSTSEEVYRPPANLS